MSVDEKHAEETGIEQQPDGDANSSGLEELLEDLQEQRTAVSRLVRQVGYISDLLDSLERVSYRSSHADGVLTIEICTPAVDDEIDTLLQRYQWETCDVRPRKGGYLIHLEIRVENQYIQSGCSLQSMLDS